MESVTVFKICDSQRVDRLIVSSTPHVPALLKKASDEMNKPVERVVLESDGCRINDDVILCLYQSQLLMLLTKEEQWKPPGAYLNISNDSIVTGAAEDKRITNCASMLDFSQPINIISEPMFGENSFISNATSGASMDNVRSDHDARDDYEFPKNVQLVPSTSGIVVPPSVEHTLQDHDSFETTDNSNDTENISPNAAAKRPGGILLQKVKKRVSTEMKFRCFQIEWTKLSDELLLKLNQCAQFVLENPNTAVPLDKRIRKTDVSAVINVIVDQLRFIDYEIPAEVMETVAKQIVAKYGCLDFADDDGFGAGQGYITLKHKLISRSSYLKRFKDPNAPMNSRREKAVLRNVRAGTLKQYWETKSEQCPRDIFSILKRNEPQTLTDDVLELSQSYIRYFLDSTMDLCDMLSELPVLRRTALLHFHFKKSTNVDVTVLKSYFQAKRMKIISYSCSLPSRKKLKLSNNASDFDIFGFLSKLLDENIDNIVIQKEIGTKLEDIHVDTPGPSLVSVAIHANEKVYYVYAENVRLNEGKECIVEAFEDLMTIYYVYNLMYISKGCKLLEFIQEYFLKIIPIEGSKSPATRVGKRQRIVRKVIQAISGHDM